MRTVSILGSGNGATAPGAEAGRALDLLRRGDSRRLRPEGARDLRRIAPTIARDEHDDRPVSAD